MTHLGILSAIAAVSSANKVTVIPTATAIVLPAAINLGSVTGAKHRHRRLRESDGNILVAVDVSVGLPERVQKLSTNPTNESAAAIIAIVAGDLR